MMSLNLLIDEELRVQANKALDDFIPIQEDPPPIRSDFPVRTAQLNGLREIAEQQPLKVVTFANHQREKAASKKGEKNERVAAFWQLVAHLVNRPESQGWSLKQMAEAHPEYQLEDLIPPFFLNFYAHYLGNRPAD
ncbi:MAG: hypothetical protein KDA84_19225 [Planctomycetaceae bacterium]|nr:hypothetical protein [Planctomycetaceae bacterium]